MTALIPYQWLYQILVVTTLAASLVGFWATYALLRGRPKAFGGALAFLAAGLVLGGIQMVASYNLRGKTAPTNVRVYLTAFTLLVMLLMRLPSIRDKVYLPGSGPGTTASAAGLTLFLAGLLTLSTPMWAGPSHMEGGFNLVTVLNLPLMLGGGAMTLIGCVLLAWATLELPIPPIVRRSRSALAESIRQ